MTLNHQYVGSNPTGLIRYDQFNTLTYWLQYMYTYKQTKSSIRKVRIIGFKLVDLMQVTQTLMITTNLIGIMIIDSTLNTGLFSDNLTYLLVSDYIFSV